MFKGLIYCGNFFSYCLNFLNHYKSNATLTF